jgi:DNA replication protein DnaC
MIPESSRQKHYETICPPLYKQTVSAKLPALAQKTLSKLLTWQYNPRGIILNGPTRQGKTRLIWLLMRKLILDQGVSVSYYDGIEWQLAVTKAFYEPNNTRAWLNRICETPIVFIDDIFKGSLSETQERALFALFERRSQNLLPIFATMNATSKTIRARMTPNGQADVADPLFHRMAEFCELITLDPEESK